MRSKPLRSILARVTVFTLTLSTIFSYSPGVALADPASKKNTITTITSDTPDPSNIGQSYTVNVAVQRNSGSDTISGTVTVSDGTNSCSDHHPSGSNSGSSKQYSCDLVSDTGGSKTLTATYSGNDNYNGSSGTALHTVNFPTCTSFTYNAWTPAVCPVSGEQTRTVATQSPTGCVGGSPVLTQSCTYVPPTCTEFTYTDSGPCLPNGTMAQTVVNSYPAGCVNGAPAATHSCNYVPPTCTYIYEDVGTCSTDGIISQRVVSSIPEGCIGQPAPTRSCQYTPPTPPTCTEFTYTDSGPCLSDGTMAQTVATKLPEGCEGGSPALTHSCTYIPSDQDCTVLTLNSDTNTQFTGLTESDPGSNISDLFNLGTPGSAVVVGPTGFPGAWDVPSADPRFVGSSWVSNNVDQPTNPAGAGVGQDGTKDTWRLFTTSFTIPSGASVTSIPTLTFSGDNKVWAYLDGALVGTAPENAYTSISNVSLAGVGAGPHTLKFVVRNDAFTGPYNPTGLIYKTSINYCVPKPPACNPEASTTIVSDTSNNVNGDALAVKTWVHTAWATIPGSDWIWHEAEVTNPSADQTNVFTKTFNIVGTVKTGDLEIAADNGFKVEINDAVIQDNLTVERNFNPAVHLDVSGYLRSGSNTLKITVKNFAQASGATYMQNPAGLLYKLNITNDECVTPPPPAPTKGDVTMCKWDLRENRLPGWTLMLEKADTVGAVQVRPDGTEYKVVGVPAGTYLVKATGQYTYRPGTTGAEYSDAAYSKRAASDAVYIAAQSNPDQSAYLPWVRENNFPSPHQGWLGIIMNNTYTDWGSAFNEAHTYQLVTTTSETKDFSFKILDDAYTDNSGFITVEVRRIYSGVTGEDGCVTFKDVPFGNYTTDEIIQKYWTNVSGIGEVTVEGNKTFEIVNKYTPPQYKVHIYKYLDSEPANIESAENDSFPMFTTYSADNIGSGNNVPFTLKVGGWSAGDADYEASTAAMDRGALYSAWENTGTDLVGETCDGNHKYALVGYSYGQTESAALESEISTRAPYFEGLGSDMATIVWNTTCPPIRTLQVHIQKYLDGKLANYESTGEYSFPMSATWRASNLNGGFETSASYVLGNGHGGSSVAYGADTAVMNAPADYETHEVTEETKVLPTDAKCVLGRYRLLGYKISDVSFEDAVTKPTSTSADLHELASDRYVIVMNETCKSPEDHDNDGDNSDHDSDDTKKLSYSGGGGGGAWLAPEPPILGNPPATSVFLPGSETDIEVTFDVKKAIMMLVSEDKNFTMMGWAPFETTTIFKLSPTNLERKFYIRFRSATGGESRTVELTAGSTGRVLGVKITRLDELVAKLKYGDHGKEVRELQTLLKNLGYFSKYFKPTTWYGPMTKAAVQKYLSSKGA